MNTVIEGDKVTIQKSQKEVFDILSVPANFSRIMPDDVAKFEAGDNWFIFGLKGMPEVKLVVRETESPSKVVLGSASDKLDFQLVGKFEDHEDQTIAQLLFEGQFNPMLKMMVERPLRNFLQKLTEKLSSL
ncbi:MAG: SRPBCC family protein [Bacteroidota bacterium]|nr:SRPBCC family protein [Bacteroidota bacterium]